MKLCRLYLVFSFVLLFAPRVESQQFGTIVDQIIFGSSQSDLIVGEQLQLQAVGLTGGEIVHTGFNWDSSDPGVLAVSDTGLATGRGVGNSWVGVSLNGSWTSVNIQVLPLRIELEGALPSVMEGETLQLQARAVDVNGTLIPDVYFEWETSGPTGYYTQTAYINETGLFYAVAEGRVTVKATIPFWGAQRGQTERLTVSTEIRIERRPGYRLTRLLATDPLTRSFKFLPGQEPGLSVNDAGQIALIGGLDGLTTGLLHYSSGNWDVLVSSGTPGAFPRSFVWGFNQTAINSSGLVLTRSNTRGDWSSLITATASGSQIVLVEGQTQGSFQQIRNFTVGRYSLNDSGDIVFRGTYDLPGGPYDSDGIFKLVDGRLQVVWGATLPLTEFPDGFNVEYAFGVDGAGTAYFTVRYEGTYGLYRADGLSAPQKIIMTGDTLSDGSLVGRIDGLSVAPSGALAFNLDVDDRERVPAMYTAATGTRILDPETLNSFYTIHSINSSNEVVFSGDVGDGWGFVRWDGSTVTSVLLGSDTVGGADVQAFRDAVITSQGTIYGLIETTESEFVVVEASSATALIQARDTIAATANLSFLSFVPGARTGNPMIYTGGDPPSIYEVTSTGLTPSWISGEAEPGTPQSGNLSSASRNPQGDLYLAAGNGVFRNGNTFETIVEYPTKLAYGLFKSVRLDWTSSWFEGGNYFAANDAGMLVWRAWSDDHDTLVSVGGGRSQLLANFGGIDRTVASSGESFADLYWDGGTDRAIALDDNGRVMANVQVLDGSGGAYLWENQSWNPVAILNETTLSGARIQWVDGLRAIGNKFYGLFNMHVGGSIIAEYDPAGWIPIVQTGGRMPNGSEIYSIGRDFEVNRRGDIAFVLHTSGGTVIVVRNSDGVMRIVNRSGEATEDGDRFWRWRDYELDLRADGSLYFIGIDLRDRKVLYEANPIY